MVSEWAVFIFVFFSYCTVVCVDEFCILRNQVFPNGDMRLIQNTIEKDDFPCGGVRVLEVKWASNNSYDLLFTIHYHLLFIHC